MQGLPGKTTMRGKERRGRLRTRQRRARQRLSRALKAELPQHCRGFYQERKFFSKYFQLSSRFSDINSLNLAY